MDAMSSSLPVDFRVRGKRSRSSGLLSIQESYQECWTSCVPSRPGTIGVLSCMSTYRLWRSEMRAT
ncbi:unnamed protein product [Polarella glacialis]|uniref:Uncharacterized protein n=1 Tax=Polarella glacialis TaxID=89957 RepID=A0A813L1V3_POLGL|nr:unnamed protein product [Polarella glacialis]